MAAVASDTTAPARQSPQHTRTHHVPIIIVAASSDLLPTSRKSSNATSSPALTTGYIIGGRVPALELPRIITISPAEISENTPLAFGSSTLRPKRFFSEANSAARRPAPADSSARLPSASALHISTAGCGLHGRRLSCTAYCSAHIAWLFHCVAEPNL